MKKILIFGSTGMLGSQLVTSFSQNSNFDIYYSSRDKEKINGDKLIYFDPLKEDSSKLALLKDFDYAINCIGKTKPFIEDNLLHSIHINSIFPHNISDFCGENNIKLIHISTDCVYSGNKGKYIETDPHDCLDFYGKSKSLGEPKNCMILRTSIIGKEKRNFVHLLSWIISQKGKETNGFSNHMWNGVTTKYFSEIIYQIIEENLFEKKLFHIHSPEDISKYELLKLINEKLNLKIKINEVKVNERIDRTLRSAFNLSSKVCTKSIQEQINEI